MAIEKKGDLLLIKMEPYTPPSLESQGTLINNYDLYKDKECKIWRGDTEAPENLVWGFDRDEIESIKEVAPDATRITLFNGDFKELYASVEKIKTWLGWGG